MFRCSLEMSTKKSTKYLPIVCPTCKTTVQSGHLARHRREVHGEAPPFRRASDEISVRSRSSSTETRATERSTPLVIRSSITALGSPPVSTSTMSSSVLMSAATALLESRKQFVRHEMVNFLVENFPGLTVNQRDALTVGTVIGAQQAASLYFLIERNRVSEDPDDRRIAIDAGSSLAYWNRGLRSRSPPSSYVMGRTTPVDAGEEPFASCLPAVTSPPAVDLSAIQVPVARDVTNADYDILAVAVAEAGIPDAGNRTTEREEINDPPVAQQSLLCQARADQPSSQPSESTQGGHDRSRSPRRGRDGLTSTRHGQPSTSRLPSEGGSVLCAGEGPRDSAADEASTRPRADVESRSEKHRAVPLKSTVQIRHDEGPLCSFEPLIPPPAPARSSPRLSATSKYRQLAKPRHSPPRRSPRRRSPSPRSGRWLCARELEDYERFKRSRNRDDRC